MLRKFFLISKINGDYKVIGKLLEMVKFFGMAKYILLEYIYICEKKFIFISSIAPFYLIGFYY